MWSLCGSHCQAAITTITPGKDVIIVGGSNGELIATRDPNHLLPAKGSPQQVDSQAFLIIPNTQLPTLITAKSQQPASFINSSCVSLAWAMVRIL